MSEKIDGISGSAFVLLGDDMDTDRIIPAGYLKCVTFDGLGDHVFENDRIALKGKHPFDNPDNMGKPVLVVGANFGCGSSREHVVPGLMQYGIKAIIGLSFAEIFRGNAVGNGLICVTVAEEDHDLISEVAGIDGTLVEVDLNKMKVCIDQGAPGDPFEVPCFMPDSDRDNLINGTWDAIDVCLAADSLIEATAARLPYFKLPDHVAA